MVALVWALWCKVGFRILLEKWGKKRRVGVRVRMWHELGNDFC